MGKVIFLNGSSSVGKTSIAKEIMNQAQDFWFFFSIDFLLNQWIDQKFVAIDSEKHEEWQKEWFFSKQSSLKDEDHPIIVAEDGLKAQALHRDIIDSITLLPKKGYNIIIDEVLITKNAFRYYATNLQECDSTVYLISVKCDLLEAERREQRRGDRWIGQSRGFLSVYANVPFYDLNIDTTSIIPAENAKIILSFIATNPKPLSFRNSLIKMNM